MILLAFDVGRKKTGVAIGNLLTGLARPLAVARGGRSAQLAAIGEHIREWAPQKLVVGLPARLDGSAHAQTRLCRVFADILHRQFDLPVEFMDERLTTVAARSASVNPACGSEMSGTADTDARAAGIILQDWLRRQQTDAAGQ